MKTKILSTGPIDENAAGILSRFGQIVIAPDNTEESLLPLLDGAIGLVVRGDGVAGAKVIEAATDLKVIGRTGVGYDNVAVEVATARGIPVIYTPGAGARAVAEAAVALMLALCKKLRYWDEQLKGGNWEARFGSKPGDLDGATLGIIGFGCIGQLLAELVRPFQMRVLAFDPYVSLEQAGKSGVERVELEVLLQRADFVSLHACLTEETRGLISRERIRLMKPGAFLINLARAGLIESLDVLYDALRDGTLAGVALDVFEPEPPDVSHPIFKLSNCLTAPHALGMTPGAMARIFRSMAEGMAAVLKGNRPEFAVNPEVFLKTSSTSQCARGSGGGTEKCND